MTRSHRFLPLLVPLVLASTSANAAAISLPTADPNLSADGAAFDAIDIGTGIDMSAFTTTVSAATGAAAGLIGSATMDVSFAFDPADPTALPSGGLASPLVSIDPGYLVLSTILEIGSTPGVVQLLFENDEPGSAGFADFNEQVLVSIELDGVTGDPFQAITDAVNAGFGFASLTANVSVDNVAAVPATGSAWLLLSGLSAALWMHGLRLDRWRRRRSPVQPN